MAKETLKYTADIEVTIELDEDIGPGLSGRLEPGYIEDVAVDFDSLKLQSKASDRALKIAGSDPWERPNWK